MARRHGLPEEAGKQLERLLSALMVEPDPPTRFRDPALAADRHVADSLSALELEEVRAGGRLADLGTGAGFPGLPLAIALPGTGVDLVESARRKTQVIDRLIDAAEVSNASTVGLRAEEWGAAGGRDAYAAVTARALASLPVLVEYAAPLLVPGGALVAWKGARDSSEEEAGAVAAGLVGLRPSRVLRVVPFAGARNRHLHVYVKEEPTPASYPRRPGRATKRPLA